MWLDLQGLGFFDGKSWKPIKTFIFITSFILYNSVNVTSCGMYICVSQTVAGNHRSNITSTIRPLQICVKQDVPQNSNM